MHQRDEELSVELCRIPQTSASWAQTVVWWSGCILILYHFVKFLGYLIFAFVKPRLIAYGRHVSDIAVTLRVVEQTPDLKHVHTLVFEPQPESTAVRLYAVFPDKRLIHDATGLPVDASVPLHSLRFEPIRALAK